MQRSQQEEYIIRCFSLLANEIAIQGDLILPDITYRQWFLLAIIAKMPVKETHVQAIADMAGSSRQNVKKMLEALEVKGYVRMQPSSQDKRALSVKLTTKAKRYLNEQAASIAQWTQSLFANYDDEEVRQLLFLLVKLMDEIT